MSAALQAAPILIMAGGTGGHVFPALAVARALRARDHEVVWLGSPRGIENRIVPDAGIRLERIRVAGLRGKGLLNWVAAPFRLLVALGDAVRVVRRVRPAAVLGMGGFAAGPGGLAAWLLRCPLVIHEQNAAAGLTNRLLAGLAREVLQAFPGSFSQRIAARTVGNPVREEILVIPDPDSRFAGRNGALRVLVIGGSQGSRALNLTVPAALALLDRETDVWHQCGAATENEARDAYRQHGVSARVEVFVDDMAAAYAWADIVICRSGALTVAELAAAGVAAVLVPYPSAVDDHQTLNARFLADAGAAVLLPERELAPPALAAILAEICADRSVLLERARRARSLAQPGATDAVAQACLQVAA